LGDKEARAGDEAVGVGEIITVGEGDFTPLARRAIVLGGDRRKSIALLDNVDSLGLFGVRISYFRSGLCASLRVVVRIAEAGPSLRYVS